MLTIQDLSYRVGGRLLLERATAQLPANWRVGLVGKNGAGKSTLLSLIRGDIAPESGEISRPPRARLGWVSQEAPGGPQSLMDFVLATDLERASLLEEAETATDPHRIGEIHTRLADISAHTAEARAGAILAGLGFDAAAQARPLSEFSGGWRMRVALAAALFAEPDILLLDEPTNHLDLEAAMWLETYLASWPRTLLVVSHDRGLLNKVPQAILHLENGRLTLYKGGYDYFEQARREKLALQAAQYAKQQEERRHIQAFVDRFRYKASKARQAQSRIKMLERMEPLAPVTEESATRFILPKPEPLSPPIIDCEDVAVGYGDTPILSRLGLRVDMDDRIGMLGANGNGKTTLLKLLSDRLKPMKGRVRKSSKLTVGYFAQNQLEELNGAQTPIEQIAALQPLATEEKIRAHLGAFGFPGGRAEVKIADLSGGEKARIALSLICLGNPHLLLLDEPTNHLDIDSRRALIDALNNYEGAVILVSHDPYLLEACVDRLWLVGNGTAAPFDGDLADYRRLLSEERRAEKKAAREAEKGPLDDGPSKRDERRARAEARQALAPIRKKAQAAEKAMEKLTKEREAIQAKLADPALYSGTADKLTALNKDLARVEEQLAEQEMIWLEAEEALAAAEE